MYERNMDMIDKEIAIYLIELIRDLATDEGYCGCCNLCSLTGIHSTCTHPEDTYAVLYNKFAKGEIQCQKLY